MQAKKGVGIVIHERTILQTVYNVFCDHCEAVGPDGRTEVDAHIVARQAGWEIIDCSYDCPDPRHAALKTMRAFLTELRQHSPAPDDSPES